MTYHNHKNPTDRALDRSFLWTKKTTHGKKQINKAYPMQEEGGGLRLEPERDKVYPMQEEEEGFRLEPERNQAYPMQEEEEGLRIQLLLTTNEWVFGRLKKLEGGREMGW